MKRSSLDGLRQISPYALRILVAILISLGRGSPAVGGETSESIHTLDIGDIFSQPTSCSPSASKPPLKEFRALRRIQLTWLPDQKACQSSTGDCSSGIADGYLARGPQFAVRIPWETLVGMRVHGLLSGPGYSLKLDGGIPVLSGTQFAPALDV